MATADHVFVNKDFFHCTICLESYKTPRSLPCLHTFCHLCLTGYIQKLLDKSGKQNLLCPVCRADTKTDSVKFNTVEKWVENFPINFTLLSILNDTDAKMDTKENYCEPCLREEHKVQAIAYCYDCTEKLCEECKRHHKKIKSSSSHKLTEFRDNTDDLDLKELEYLANLSKCPKHSSEEVKYLCKDHDELCCNECAIVTHRKCEDMVSLADEVSKKVTVDVLETLEVIEKQTDELIEHESSYVDELATKEAEVKNVLRQFKEDIDNAYDKLEKKVLSEMSSRTLKLSKESSLHKESAETLKEDIKRAADKFQKTSNLGTATHIFLVEREMEKLVKKYEEMVSDIHHKTSTTALTLIEARPSRDATEAIHDLFQVQEVTTEPDLPSFPTFKRDFKNMTVTFVKEFVLQENNQPRYCLWIGSCIIIAFEHRSKINVYSEEDGSCLSSYACPSGPTALAQLENGEIAVALPHSSKIDIIKLEKNQLSHVRELASSMSELITFNRKSKQLFALSKSNGKIQKFCLDDREAGSITLDTTGRTVLAGAYNVAFDTKFTRLYISSHDVWTLLCVDTSGKTVFQYKHEKLQHPWSVIVDSDGNIYIACYSSACVQQLTKDGQLLREITSEQNSVKYPMGMSFNAYMNRIAITCDRPAKVKILQYD